MVEQSNPSEKLYFELLIQMQLWSLSYEVIEAPNEVDN